VSQSCDLQNQIGNVPLCLALLAQTNLVAAEGVDFSLTGNFKAEFKHLKFPDSFRASVSQVRCSKKYDIQYIARRLIGSLWAKSKVITLTE